MLSESHGIFKEQDECGGRSRGGGELGTHSMQDHDRYGRDVPMI